MEQEMPRSEIIRKAIELGRPRGFVTFDQLNELLPSTTTAPEDSKRSSRRFVTKK
jgi:Sigma-70 factor, region 1.1